MSAKNNYLMATVMAALIKMRGLAPISPLSPPLKHSPKWRRGKTYLVGTRKIGKEDPHTKVRNKMARESRKINRRRK